MDVARLEALESPACTYVIQSFVRSGIVQGITVPLYGLFMGTYVKYLRVSSCTCIMYLCGILVLGPRRSGDLLGDLSIYVRVI